MSPTPHDRRQDRLLARADRAADSAESVVRGVWLRLLAAVEAGGPYFVVRRRAAAALRSLPAAAHAVRAELGGVARDAARWAAEALAKTLTADRRAKLLLRRRGVLEREDEPLADPLVGHILPSLTTGQVDAVLLRHGWGERLQALTRLVEPEALASEVATLVSGGKTIDEIARLIRPRVQGVQTAARRVARTAGLWVAHEAELHTYDQLGDLVVGYEVRAVLDHATRPEHRKRDGTKYYREPKAGQKGMKDMPHPPRESDGSWAFNCRCFLVPLLDQG